MTDDDHDDPATDEASPDAPKREDDDGAEAPTRVRETDDEPATLVRGAQADAAMAAGDDDPTARAAHLADEEAAAPQQRQAVGVGSVLRKRFELVEKLGEGGMGGVYKARDAYRDLEKHPYVAIKILNETFVEHPDAEKALKTEATKSQALNHRNIAGVFDFDHDDDTWFISMELLEGEPLDRILKRHKDGGLPREQALSIIRDMAEGLGYAHAEHRLVHSDFKPGNIFITESGRAKVFDFGIARAATDDADVHSGDARFDPQDLGDDSRDETRFDIGNLRALTPAYASREMFDNLDPAPQDDVYALGVVAYMCLTGKHPFERRKAFEAEALDMKPQRPDGLTGRQWRALQHALAFRRENRTPDAAAFVDEFFGETQRWPLVAGVAVALLAMLGWWLLPSGPGVPVPPQWESLDATMDVSAALVDERLAEAAAPAFEFSGRWSEATVDALARWRRALRSEGVIEVFDSPAAAQSAQQQWYETHGLVTRVDVPAADADTPVRLVVGPFPGDTERSHSALDAALAAAREAGAQAEPLPHAARIEAAERRVLDIHRDAASALLEATATVPELPVVAEGAGALQLDAEALASFEVQLERLRDVHAALVELEAPSLATWRDALQARLAQWEGRLAAQRARVAQDNLGTAVESSLIEAQAQRSRYMQQLAAVRAVFNNQCGSADALRGALDDFDALQRARSDLTRVGADGVARTVDDQRAVLESLRRCAASRIAGQPADVRAALALVADHVQAAHPQAAEALRRVQPPDPCSAPRFVGSGSLQQCSDQLAAGGSSPATVVIPAPEDGAVYGIGRYEVTVAQYNAYCAASGCAAPAQGADRIPVTDVSLEAARAYAAWLSAQTGRRYRLPTLAEWRHAAVADGAPPDPNRNCSSSVRGVVKGEQLISATQGTPNAWGLINHLGNAREWVQGSGRWLVAGGRHSDELADCSAATATPHDGAPDAFTGFRIVREITP